MAEGTHQHSLGVALVHPDIATAKSEIVRCLRTLCRQLEAGTPECPLECVNGRTKTRCDGRVTARITVSVKRDGKISVCEGGRIVLYAVYRLPAVRIYVSPGNKREEKNTDDRGHYDHVGNDANTGV